MVEHRHVEWDPLTRRILTTRLLLRPWQLDGDLAAFGLYGAPEVSRWLCPALPLITDDASMRQLLGRWIAESDAAGLPLGRYQQASRGSRVGAEDQSRRRSGNYVQVDRERTAQGRTTSGGCCRADGRLKQCMKPRKLPATLHPVDLIVNNGRRKLKSLRFRVQEKPLRPDIFEVE